MKTNLTYLKSSSTEAKFRPIVVLIPGGPGLSSKTLQGLETLTRSFDLALLDPPGTAGHRDIDKQNFDSVLASFELALKILDRPLLLVGHSFGGYQAACLAARKNLTYVGLVGLSSPLSEKSFNAISVAYDKHKTPTLTLAEETWIENKTLENLRQWFLSYELLWFSEKTLSVGKRLIKDDLMSLNAFLGVEPNFSNQDQFFNILRELKLHKMLIAGENDILVSSDLLKSDADEVGFEFNILKNAAHFINLDEPEAVAKLIENKFIDSKTGVPI